MMNKYTLILLIIVFAAIFLFGFINIVYRADKKHKIILIVSLVAVIVSSYSIKSINDSIYDNYHENVCALSDDRNKAEDIIVKYNNKEAAIGDVYSKGYYTYRFLDDAKLYFGSLPKDGKTIKLTLTDKAVFTVYPEDNDHSIILFEPKKGMTLKYIAKFNFQVGIQALYEITKNEIFKT